MAPRNLITDVAGVRVGHADDARLASGVTAILFDRPAAAAVDVRGGAPGTRETDLLDAHRTVAADRRGGAVGRLGLRARCRRRACRPGCASSGRGFAVGDICVPIVCGAVLFDLLNGGDKNWGKFPPYRDLGYRRRRSRRRSTSSSAPRARASARPRSISRAGSARRRRITREGHTVGAIVAVNACGSVTVGASRHFWAAPFEQDARIRRLRLAADRAGRRAASRTPRDGRARTRPSRWSRPTPRSTRRSAIRSR